MSTESIPGGNSTAGRRSTFIAPEHPPKHRSRVSVEVDRTDERTESLRVFRGLLNATLISLVFWAVAGLAGFGIYLLVNGL